MREDIKSQYKALIEPSENFQEAMEISLQFLRQHLRSFPLEMREIIDELLVKAKEEKDDKALANLYYLRGWTKIDYGKYTEGQEDFVKSYDLFSLLNDAGGLIQSLNALGFSYSSLGDPAEAFKKFDEALEIASQENDEVAMAKIFGNIGESFLELKQYDDALENFNKSLSLEVFLPNRAIVTQKIGHVYHLLGDNEKSLEYLNNALELTEKEEMMMIKLGTLVSLGAVYRSLGETDKAIEALKEVTRDAHDSQWLRMEADSALNLGRILLDEKQLDEALEYFKRALKIAQDINVTSLKADALRNISDIFKERQRWQEAYNFFAEYHKEDKEFFSQEAAKEIDRLKIKEVEREVEFFKQMYQQISSISQIGQEITSSLDLKEIVYIIYNNLNELLDTSVFGLGLYDEANNEINYRFFIEAGEWLTPFTTGIDEQDTFGAWCIKTGQEIVMSNVNKEYHKYVKRLTATNPSDEEKVKSVIYVPLKISNRIIGILSVQSHIEKAYDDYQVQIFRALASYVTIAVENAKLYEEVQELAAKDPLTGLLNRGHFNRLAEEEFQHYRETGEEFSLVMFDLDHFKRVNDQYGHDAGDLVLKEVASFFSSRLRRTDIFSRYGGEEFLALLAGTKLKEALGFTERLRAELNEHEINLGNGEKYIITASFGLASVKPADRAIKEIIKRADIALYDSKTKGRNIVSCLD